MLKTQKADQKMISLFTHTSYEYSEVNLLLRGLESNERSEAYET